MSGRLKGIAKDTLSILEAGAYNAPSGAPVSLRDAAQRAIDATRLYRPVELAAILKRQAGASSPAVAKPRFEVTSETTTAAARRLLAAGEPDVVALNFASAKNAGGGFLSGAKAQEEDLVRASALYLSLMTQREYYDVNRATSSMLYTDHMIYSPAVPFFRDDDWRLLEAVALVSIITAPAPNAGEHLRRHPNDAGAITETLRRRAGMVLGVAAANSHRVVVLGAWGCGVFRNDPVAVADAFGLWLESHFLGAFDRVVFPIYSRAEQSRTREAFRQRFTE